MRHFGMSFWLGFLFLSSLVGSAQKGNAQPQGSWNVSYEYSGSTTGTNVRPGGVMNWTNSSSMLGVGRCIAFPAKFVSTGTVTAVLTWNSPSGTPPPSYLYVLEATRAHGLGTISSPDTLSGSAVLDNNINNRLSVSQTDAQGYSKATTTGKRVRKIKVEENPIRLTAVPLRGESTVTQASSIYGTEISASCSYTATVLSPPVVLIECEQTIPEPPPVGPPDTRLTDYVWFADTPVAQWQITIKQIASRINQPDEIVITQISASSGDIYGRELPHVAVRMFQPPALERYTYTNTAFLIDGTMKIVDSNFFGLP